MVYTIIYIMVYIMVYTMIYTMAYTISCTFSIYHAPEKVLSKGPQTENAVGLFDFPPGGLSCFVGHIGLQEFPRALLSSTDSWCSRSQPLAVKPKRRCHVVACSTSMQSGGPQSACHTDAQRVANYPGGNLALIYIMILYHDICHDTIQGGIWPCWTTPV
jgi:hypothetical protein